MMRRASTKGIIRVKKIILSIIFFLLFLISALGDASYLIKLKNGRQLATPEYWFEGKLIFLYYAGGITGMERAEIEKIEKYDNETKEYTDKTLEKKATGASPVLSSVPGKKQEPDNRPETKKGDEKVNLEVYKKKKDEMTVELNRLLGKIREENKKKDKDAKEKTREEMRNLSTEIYNLTDEVTKMNNGKLPEGWWGQ
jgi:hypothetical protein